MANRNRDIFQVSLEELGKALDLPEGTKVIDIWVEPEANDVAGVLVDHQTLPMTSTGQTLPRVVPTYRWQDGMLLSGWEDIRR